MNGAHFLLPPPAATTTTTATTNIIEKEMGAPGVDERLIIIITTPSSSGDDDDAKLKQQQMIKKADGVRNRFIRFWRYQLKDDSIELLCSDEESRYITNPRDSQQMCKAVALILDSLGHTTTTTTRRLHFIDAFACVGSDALAAARFLGPAFLVDVLCIQPNNNNNNNNTTEAGRYTRLHHNSIAMQTAVPILTFPIDIKQFLKVYASTFSKGGAGFILYMDPPWDSPDIITAFIDSNVLKPWMKEGWPAPVLVCLKVPSLLNNSNNNGGVERLLRKRLGRVYECAGNLHVRSKYFFSFFVMRK
jgi:hypothetical protein